MMTLRQSICYHLLQAMESKESRIIADVMKEAFGTPIHPDNTDMHLYLSMFCARYRVSDTQLGAWLYYAGDVVVDKPTYDKFLKLITKIM
jgi:hypothetical protein